MFVFFVWCWRLVSLLGLKLVAGVYLDCVLVDGPCGSSTLCCSSVFGSCVY